MDSTKTDFLCDEILKACEAISGFYGKSEHITKKSDGSFLTPADLASEAILVEALKAITPGIPIVSEESFDATEEVNYKTFWCIDPLDGTEGFVKQNGMFCINIALIRDGKAVFGCIAEPLTKRVWFNEGTRIYLRENKAKPRLYTVIKSDRSSLYVVTSPHYGSKMVEFIQEKKYIHVLRLGSGLKFIALLENKADLYPRLSTVCEWDIAAGDALLRAMGGGILDLDGKSITYGNQGFKTGPFLACRSLTK